MAHASRLAVLALLIVAAPLHAAVISPPAIGPSPFNSGSWVRDNTTSIVSGVLAQERTNSLSDGDQTGSRDSTNGFQSASHSTSLANGTVGAAVQSGPGPDYGAVSASAAIFDTLTFDFNGAPSGTVQFSLSVDGTLANSATSSGVVIGGASVQVVDVTGLGNSFFFAGQPTNREGGLLLPNDDQVLTFGTLVTVDPLRLVDESGGMALITPDLEQDVINGTYGIGVADSFAVNNSGVPVDFVTALTGQFVAEAGRQYALQITTEVLVSGGPGSADLLNTSTFVFTDLSGGSFVSASGVFPGSVAAPPGAGVPLPASAWLLLAGVFWLRRSVLRARG